MSHWDNRFMDLAFLVASWSKDPSTKVGAVITKDNRVISLGFNGIPTGLDDEKYLVSRDLKILTAMHAESNAIDFARGDLEGSTIYSTHHPCPACSGRIIQNGFARVVTIEPDKDEDFRKRWNLDHSIMMLEDSGIEVTYIEKEENDQHAQSNCQCQQTGATSEAERE